MKVLVVEDESRIQEFMLAGLRSEGYEAEGSLSAEDAMPLVKQQDFDAYVLDLMLPGMDGTEFCRWLRDRGLKVPILMLTAKSGLQDKIAGLDSGADDYLTKPFEVTELLARLRALMRKTKGYPRAVLSAGDLVLDPNTRLVKRGDHEIVLSGKESLLLEFLLKNKDTVVTRPMISQAVWETGLNTYTNIIDVFVNHLRKKIDGESSTKLIRTIRGKGFMISDRASDAEEIA